jgi:predicted amidohydrolase YtcJ
MSTVLFHNGTIYPGRGLPPLDHLLVVDGVIAAWAGEAVDERFDLDGGFLCAAFGDGHAHPILAGRESLGPDIRSGATVAEIVKSVSDWADAHPDSEWIIGGSYDATVADQGLFDARWLDESIADRPVMLRAWDYHTVWCNTAALERAGINAETPEPQDGRIPRRPDGSPLGTLMEWGAVDLMMSVAPRPSIDDGIEALRFATRKLAENGITWVQDAWVEPDDLEVWLAAEAAGALFCRADLALRADPGRWATQRYELEDLRGRLSESNILTCRTVKFFVDGILENHTAHLIDDYSDACTRGLPVWDDQGLNDAVVWADKLGFEIHLHAIGDAAVRSALDAIENVLKVNGARDRRPVIAHAQLVDSDDLARFAELGVIACFQPQWATSDPVMIKLTLPRLGEIRGPEQYRIASIIESGAAISFGSDWPVSNPSVIAGIRTAITRQDSNGLPEHGWIPAERITIDAALHAATHGVAYQANAEGMRGSLFSGYSADLVWLSADPLRTAPSELADIAIQGTWLSGRRTYDHRHPLE